MVKYSRNVVKISLFLVSLVLCLGMFHRTLRFKHEDGIYGLDTFYRLEENTVDVLILGSSHAFVDINPAVLYSEYGIAGFDLGGSIQPFWNSYFYLQEALKTQRPKVIILEAFAATRKESYSDESRIIKNNFGIKFSKNKIESLKASTPQEKSDYLFEWIYYHNRYKEVNETDFGKYLGNKKKYKDWKGHYSMSETREFPMPMLKETISLIPMPDKQKEYLRKIFELTLKERIPLVVIVSPYAGYSEREAGMYLDVQQIAKEYGIPFVNYNERYSELGLNFLTDCADKDHLNYLGSEKLSRSIGEYLILNYDIEDRRGETYYKTWERNAEYYYQYVDNIELQKVIDLKTYLTIVSERDCGYIIAISKYGNAEEMGSLQDWFELCGSEDVSNGTWVMDNGKEIFGPPNEGEYFFHTELGKGDLAVRGEMGHEEVVFDRKIMYTVNEGINICVWDMVTEEMVDNVWFDATNNWIGERSEVEDGK